MTENQEHITNANETATRLTALDAAISAGEIDIMEALEGQILDTRYLFNSQGVCIEIHNLVAFGGPNIWEHYYLDNEYATVHYSWYSVPTVVEAYAPELANFMFELAPQDINI